MQTMSQSLLELHQRRLISTEEALAHATEPEELKIMLGQTQIVSDSVRPMVRR
jgi:Tfp pilus assembly ATPase PilU